MSLLEKFHTDEGRPPAERPRGVAPVRLGGTAGVSRDVLRDLNAAAKDDRRPLLPPPVRTDPTPGLRASTAIELAVYMETNYVLDDIVAALGQLAAPIEHAENDHAERMRLVTYFAEKTGAEAAV